MPTTPNGTDYTVTEFTPLGGSLSTWAAPTALLTAGEPVNLLIYCHGSSGAHNDLTAMSVWADFRHRLIDNGWGWVETLAYDPAWGAVVNNWGGPTGVLHYRLAYEHAAAHMNVATVAILGRSMGGLAAINLYLHDPVVSQVAQALILNSATQDLTYRSLVTAGSVAQFRVAYGYPNDQAYIDALPSIDPMLYPLSLWQGKRVMQVVADADDVVEPEHHGLAMRARTHAVLDQSPLVVAYGGDHGASGGYSKGREMFAFLDELVNGPRGEVTAMQVAYNGERRNLVAIKARHRGVITDATPSTVRL